MSKIVGMSFERFIRDYSYNPRRGGSLERSSCSSKIPSLALAFAEVLLIVLIMLNLSTPNLRAQESLNLDETYAPIFVDKDDTRFFLLDGPIDLRTAFNLKRAILEYGRPDVLLLNSPGGNLHESLTIAFEIRERGVRTVVLGGCYSACFFVFAGGLERAVLGKLGVHQFSGAEDPTAGQVATADIVDALNNLGISSEVVPLMLRTPPEEMYVFNEEELSSFGLITEFYPPIGKDGGPAIVESGFVLREGYHIPKMDMLGRERLGISRSACIAYCASIDGCRAFSYNRRRRGCYPKMGIITVERYPGVDSGAVESLRGRLFPPTESVTSRTRGLEDKTDFPGRDLADGNGVRPVSLERCREICLQDRQCRAYTYVADKRWCFPKSSVSRRRPERRAVSEQVR